MTLRLYHHWRSSSSWRVRWAFALKGIACEMVDIDLLTDAPERPEHLARNPLGYVPVLERLDGGAPRFLAESMAIIEWAEETRPAPPLLPADPWLRARARQLAEMVNSGTQPLQNPNAFELHSSDREEQKRWCQHWIRKGLGALERLLPETAGRFAVGDAVTLADLFLIPQCANARRYHVPLDEFPTIARIEAAALETEPCWASAPERAKPA